MRNAGSGLAVLHGWRFYPERRGADPERLRETEFTRLEGSE
ncbi:MAG: hypothetical protein WBB76_02130 [Gaiellaceae bacterium]